MKYIPFIALLALTACGADGPPERPAAKPGMTVSGEAAIGVAKG